MTFYKVNLEFSPVLVNKILQNLVKTHLALLHLRFDTRAHPIWKSQKILEHFDSVK